MDIDGTVDSLTYSSNEALRKSGNRCSPACLNSGGVRDE